MLAELAGGPSIFPFRARLSRPTTADLSARYDDVRTWARDLHGLAGARVVSAVRGTRSIGANQLPHQVWIDDLATAAALLGETRAVERFARLVEVTEQRQARLTGWLAERSLDALAVADDWERLLLAVEWVAADPRPGIYLRQVDLPGIDTKFVGRHARVLASLLDAVLPPSAIADGETRFERRYGFRSVPRTVHVRALDPALVSLAGGDDQPVVMTLDDFARLTGLERLFVTENYVNFLAFPAAPGSLVVFGEGYDVAKIATARWVAEVPVYYWGDIDTHGFGDPRPAPSPAPTGALAADGPRHAPRPRSALGQPKRARSDATWLDLTRPERDLYDDLRDNRIRANLRLEQELTHYCLIESAVHAIALGVG